MPIVAQSGTALSFLSSCSLCCSVVECVHFHGWVLPDLGVCRGLGFLVNGVLLKQLLRVFAYRYQVPLTQGRQPLFKFFICPQMCLVRTAFVPQILPVLVCNLVLRTHIATSSIIFMANARPRNHAFRVNKTIVKLT